ncbi:GIY-YIG nuclease family protein [Enterobacter ludwigii]|uniref:GIY-YIG nuclease family protein n=1 Tax=Enterobacter ludwigii TaxID=299767 RepID=A0AAX3LEG6_9ENTR|nr:GIY-YIG nuclease family protein [Enterobacter ludwigii]WCE14715.1 GIY-YIG nuclease family protein [Enterobacter ludwigii]
MKEEIIYMCFVQNIHTKEICIKLGYSSNIEARMKQLQQRNEHYQYSDFLLFKHKKKRYGYLRDEQLIHIKNRKYVAPINPYAMPEGYTECYEFGYGYDLVDQLRELGYECVNVEAEVEVQTPMFQW